MWSIVRIEQAGIPSPEDDLAEVLPFLQAPESKVVWCQENR